MAYVPDETTYRLVFADGKRAGLEVTCGEGTVDDYLIISDLATEQFSNPPTKGDLVRIRGLFQALAGVLRGWNIERPAGNPIPATVEGVGRLGISLALDIALAWMEAVAGVDNPLPTPSESTEPDESLIPMETLASGASPVS